MNGSLSQRRVLSIGICANILLVIIFLTAPIYTHRAKLPICNRFDIMGPATRKELSAALSVVTIGSTVLLFLVCITVCRNQNKEYIAAIVAYLAVLSFIIEVNVNKLHPSGVPGDDNFWLHKAMTIALIASVAVVIACMVNRTGMHKLHLVSVACIGGILFILSQWSLDKKWVTEQSWGWNGVYYIIGVNLLLPLYALVHERSRLTGRVMR